MYFTVAKIMQMSSYEEEDLFSHTMSACNRDFNEETLLANTFP